MTVIWRAPLVYTASNPSQWPVPGVFDGELLHRPACFEFCSTVRHRRIGHATLLRRTAFRREDWR